MECIVCGNSAQDHGMTFTSSSGDVWGACDSCRADAALGRAVRNFKDGEGIRKSGPYFCCHDYNGDYSEWDTPEEALKDAGFEYEEI